MAVVIIEAVCDPLEPLPFEGSMFAWTRLDEAVETPLLVDMDGLLVPGELIKDPLRCFNCPIDPWLGLRPSVQVKCCMVLRMMYQEDPMISE